MTHVFLTRLQENELELLLAGTYGEREYSLPQAGPHAATLLAPLGTPVAGTVELLDRETTPIASLEVTAALEDRRGTWLAGPVTALREPAAPAFAALRPGSAPRVQSARVFLDDGHDNPLARAVHAAGGEGDVRVLPVPAADHLEPAELPETSAREALLKWLAERAFADTVEIDTSVQDAHGEGLVILLTGLSGSGKSTIARRLAQRLRETDSRPVTLLDGDEVRAMLSAGLGFSRDDRILNVRRIGWVAAKIAEHGGIAIAAPIAPYESMRDEARTMAERVGSFMLVHVATPLEVCEARDRKGLYAKARAGLIPEFTGISDPYEEPVSADVVVGSSAESTDDSVLHILDRLRAE